MTTARVMSAFLKRDFLLNTSYRLAFMIQIVGVGLGASIFYFISRIFGDAASPMLAAYGGNYFAFVIIGVAFADYLGAGLNSLSATIRDGQVTGTLELMLLTPTRLSVVLLASSLWSFVFPSLRILVFMVSGVLLFGLDLSHANVLSSVVVLIISVICFAGMGLLSASFVMVFKQGDPIGALVTALAGLFGGALYPVEVLPPALQVISAILPVTYALRAIRLAVLQGYNLTELRGDLMVLIMFSLLLVPLGLAAFGFAVKRAKIDGSLAQY